VGKKLGTRSPWFKNDRRCTLPQPKFGMDDGAMTVRNLPANNLLSLHT
jgi:hypothetical protein